MLSKNISKHTFNLLIALQFAFVYPNMCGGSGWGMESSLCVRIQTCFSFPYVTSIPLLKKEREWIHSSKYPLKNKGCLYPSMCENFVRSRDSYIPKRILAILKLIFY